MKSNQVIEAVFELTGSGDVCAARIANSIGGSVVDAIDRCNGLQKAGMLTVTEEGFGLTEDGMKQMEALTA